MYVYISFKLKGRVGKGKKGIKKEEDAEEKDGGFEILRWEDGGGKGKEKEKMEELCTDALYFRADVYSVPFSFNKFLSCPFFFFLSTLF